MLRRTLILLFTYVTIARADAPLIYREHAIANEAQFNPISHYLNLAFDTTQNPNYFSQYRYFPNHGVLWQRVRDPIAGIRDYGFWHFVGDEIFGLRAVPNYTLHLIGGGYDYRWLAEWYEAHGFPAPYVFAFVNSYLADIGNEALETSAVQVGPTDHIADLFIFDIAGKLLFTNDSVVRFFHDEMGMRAWHFQPMFNVRTAQIDNAGSNYIFRPEWFGRDVRPFAHVGLSILGGASFRVGGTDALTLAAGFAPTDPLVLRGDAIGAIYYDRDGALLASLTLNGTGTLAARLNVYPDLIPTGPLRLGAFLGYAKAGKMFVGLSAVLPAGLAVSF